MDVARLDVARLDVPGMIHGFIAMRGMIAAADRALDAIASELRARLAP